jgi:hypothetical protein
MLKAAAWRHFAKCRPYGEISPEGRRTDCYAGADSRIGEKRGKCGESGWGTLRKT